LTNHVSLIFLRLRKGCKDFEQENKLIYLTNLEKCNFFDLIKLDLMKVSRSLRGGENKVAVKIIIQHIQSILKGEEINF
jgi:hypothetical protein